MSDWIQWLTLCAVVVHAIAHAIGKALGLVMNNNKPKGKPNE
jgi:hypothetical protein